MINKTNKNTEVKEIVDEIKKVVEYLSKNDKILKDQKNFLEYFSKNPKQIALLPKA